MNSLLINESLNEGSQLPYIRRALNFGFGVLVMNTNHNHSPDGRLIHVRLPSLDFFNAFSFSIRFIDLILHLINIKNLLNILITLNNGHAISFRRDQYCHLCKEAFISTAVLIEIQFLYKNSKFKFLNTSQSDSLDCILSSIALYCECKMRLQGSGTAEEHAQSVYRTYIAPHLADRNGQGIQRLLFVAHSYGGCVMQSLVCSLHSSFCFLILCFFLFRTKYLILIS